MITISALLFPSMIFLIWTIVLLCMKDKIYSQKKLIAFLLISTVYFYIDAFYLMPDASPEDYKALVFLDILRQFITLTFPAAAIVYIISFRGKRRIPMMEKLMFLPGAALGTAAVIIYSIMGTDTAAGFMAALDKTGGIPANYSSPVFRAHEAICQKAYDIILLAELLIALVAVFISLSRHPISRQTIDNFIDGKEKLSSFPAECILIFAMLAICAVRIVVGRYFLINKPALSSLMSISVGMTGCLIAYIGVFFPDREFDHWDLRHPLNLRASETGHSTPDAMKDSRPNGQQSGSAEVKEEPSSQHAGSPAPSLLEQFLVFMDKKKPYLNPNLSISDVAFALGSNRTYVSVLINENFEMNFRDYVNRRRINHAKEIMMKNPDEILEVIAEKSGFESGTTFARKFKEIEYISPKEWLVKQLSLK